MVAVSVVIPTYNRSKLVAQALRSVLAQTFEDFEVILVDDGSTDDTREVVAAFRDPRIVYLWQENQQRCAARNNGVAHASGRYVAFLDSDDVWFPNKLERQMAAFAAHPEVGLVFSNVVRISGENTFPNPVEFLQPDRETMANMHEDLLTLNRIPLVTSVVKKELLDEAGEFDRSLPHAEDWDMWIRVSKNADFCRINAPLAAYRVHAGMRTANPVSTLRGDLIIIEKYLGDGSESSNRLRQRAEMLCYARRALEAYLSGLPDGKEWVLQAQDRADCLGTPSAVADWLTVLATSRLSTASDERMELGKALAEMITVLDSVEPECYLRRFWLEAVLLDYRIRDYRGAVRTALKAFINSKLSVRLLYVGTRAATRALLTRRGSGTVSPMQRLLPAILEGGAE